MRNLLILLALTVSSVVSPRGLLANTGGSGHIGLDETLESVLGKYGVNSLDELDCDSVAREDYITIGDALMEEIHPGKEHERMDAMMGGEGSRNLEQMHFNMGASYLGCGWNQNDSKQPSMMGPGMMGTGMTNSMVMDSLNTPGYIPDSSRIYSYAYGLVYVLIVGFLISGTYFFIKKSKEVSKK